MGTFLLTYLSLCGIALLRVKWVGKMNHKAIILASKKDIELINQHKFDEAIYLDKICPSYTKFFIQIFTITKWTVKDFYPFLED